MATFLVDQHTVEVVEVMEVFTWCVRDVNSVLVTLQLKMFSSGLPPTPGSDYCRIHTLSSEHTPALSLVEVVSVWFQTMR